MADIYSPENLIASVYKWADKEVSSDVTTGARTNFKLANNLQNALNLGTIAHPDYVDASGNVALRDYAVYYRKNGVDTRVDESALTTPSATTVVFASAVATETADSIVVSYPYIATGDKTTFTCIIKDFSKSGGDSDSEVENTIGGCSYKTRKPAGLVEISLTAIKNGIRLSDAVNGDWIKTTTEIGTKTVLTTTKSSNTKGRMIVIKGIDPTTTNIELIAVARNVDGVSADHSGGADKAWEETVTFKTDQQNLRKLKYQEINVISLGG